MILRSARLSRIAGLVHGFGTRLGGVSEGAYASLNLGRGLGDAESAVAANRARLAAMVGLGAGDEIVELEQVHGVRILEAEVAAVREQADGAITSRRGLALSIRSADCAPILIAAEGADGGLEAIAAVHAGWRGATAGIAVAAVQKLLERGATIGSLAVAIGPTIGPEAFEVGEEVVAAAEASLGGETPPISRGDNGKARLDLRGLLLRQLLQAGLHEDRVESVGGCTVSAPALYFSHRRDAGKTGRMLSLIAIR